MRYKGNTSYQTTTGGFCHILLMCFVTWFTIEQLIQLSTKSDPSVVKNTIYHDHEELGIKTAKEIHFDIGVGAYYQGQPDMIDIDGYGKIRIFQMDSIENEISLSELTLKPCLEADSKLKGLSEGNELITKTFNGARCADPKEIMFQGFQ